MGKVRKLNILFFTLSFPFETDNSHLYLDLVKEFIEQGHQVNVICPVERQYHRSTSLEIVDQLKILRIRTLNLTSTPNFIEKGVGLLVFPLQVIQAIKKYFRDEKIDLILYATPPVTFAWAVSYAKRKFNAMTYLMLKDIFPHNAVDLGLIKKTSLLWIFFRKVEIQLYNISDVIGCLSPANINFIQKQNPFIPEFKLEEFPNSLRLNSQEIAISRDVIREKLAISTKKIVLIYGGNLGVPQGISFLLQIINQTKDLHNFHIVIAGKGSEYDRIKAFIHDNQLKHISLFSFLPIKEYNALVKASDIGLILLDKKFTMPNFPSRLLAYLEAGIPIISATDTATDIGRILEAHQCGFNLVHSDILNFIKTINLLLEKDAIRIKMGENAKKLLLEKYTTKQSYEIIMNHFTNVETSDKKNY